MVDMCKCEGKNCKIKEQCYRYTAKADEYYQSWFDGCPAEEFPDGSQSGCLYFIQDRRKQNATET